MKRMAHQAGIENEGHFTNTSGRKTAVQSLRGIFDPVEISELTGHANPSSIQSYSHNALQTQQEICNRLAGTSSNVLQSNVQTNTQTTSVNLKTDQTLSSIFNCSTFNACQIQVNFKKMNNSCKKHALLNNSCKKTFCFEKLIVIYCDRSVNIVFKRISKCFKSISVHGIYNQNSYLLHEQSTLRIACYPQNKPAYNRFP